MPTFVIDVPVPSMGATASELTVIKILVEAGAKVAKGEKLAALESDKSAFDYEAPADGVVLGIMAKSGATLVAGDVFMRMETGDESLRHLEVKAGGAAVPPSAAAPVSAAAKALVWTPRAIKLAQEAGLDHATLTDIGATGPGGRVSGDDVTAYLASRK